MLFWFLWTKTHFFLINVRQRSTLSCISNLDFSIRWKNLRFLILIGVFSFFIIGLVPNLKIVLRGLLISYQILRNNVSLNLSDLGTIPRVVNLILSVAIMISLNRFGKWILIDFYFRLLLIFYIVLYCLNSSSSRAQRRLICRSFKALLISRWFWISLRDKI